MTTKTLRPILLSALLVLCTAAIQAQHGAPDGDWPHYGGDRGSTKFTALDQIDEGNVAGLQLAWSWKSIDAELPKAAMGGHFKATPLEIGGRLYLTTPLQQAVALDAANGELLWRYDPKVYDVGRPTNTGFQHRGLEWWKSEIPAADGGEAPRTIERLFFATGARQLISLDPATGLPDPAFGDAGIVDTTQGLGEINPRMVAHNAPPIVCGDTVVLGSIIFDGPTHKTMPPGHVRGFDPRTGALKWVFHTIPQGSEFGVDTWEDDSWRYTGNTNVWTMMSCDEERGIVYLPTSTPTNDWYGGHRKGDNLFAESLVALDAASGERLWHFQAVHHGVWDYDFPCAPNLVDIPQPDGSVIPAVAQVSKQGFTYVFDRRDGTPIWPIEERPVPQSTVPGEKTSPTQPFPTKPPPFERQGITEDDIVDFTPELRDRALEILRQYQWGPIFTPPIVVGEGGKQGTIQVPSAAGGANWGGAAVDPRSARLFVPSMSLVMINALDKPDAARSDFDYIRVGDWLPRGLDGIPFLKPPYGRITAIDLVEGEHDWMVAHGAGPKDHPLLAHLDLPDLGANAHGVLSNGGLVLTDGLLFIIQGEWDPDSMLRVGEGGFLRAYRTSDGAKLWEKKLDKTPHGTPMSYLHGGVQYVVVAVGRGPEAELLAFSAPFRTRRATSGGAGGSQP
ncbi:MAG: pyrroloquinoline quinone-dependent dehydrogenase [Acidobacteria bacterium]|nr:MAG: pyrroloquinoline quinone-dependent dehydrogenase [Acidobacteriota bacterium]REK01021.1 MAG: pyrroloquinoline quinone-dependent dehydrogenase [Acidobacteriota bacterium]